MPPAPAARPSASIAPASPLPSRVPGDSTDDHLASLFARPLDRGATTPAASDVDTLARRALAFPLPGFDRARLVDNFAELRGSHVHEAIDIPAPRGTPVLAVDDGPVQKLFVSRAGGNTVYQFDPTGTYCYYYAHLDSYEPGLAEGQTLRKGDPVGRVGTSGNSPPDAPHLHFTIFKLGDQKRWWEGTPINPFPLWALRREERAAE
jgi:murein DD-endopeptidase MepM/ murein hydrolase activator NlpD